MKQFFVRSALIAMLQSLHHDAPRRSRRIGADPRRSCGADLRNAGRH